MEIMGMTDSMRKLVLDGASGSTLYQQAVNEGMTTMRESAVRKALDLQIPASEIVRVFAQED